MKHTVTAARVREQLERELEAVRGFERNVNTLLAAMRDPNPCADYEAEARGLRYNQQYTALYLARASAVLELLGECRDGEVNTGDDLEGFIQALE